jgi:succinate-semialdehyde dehydrogenase/glutarate-semialdehyde dehydrogenase
MNTVLISTNPSKGYEVLGEVKISTEEDVVARVSVARKAQKNWAALGVDRRIQKMKKLYALIKENNGDLARRVSLEMGKSMKLSVPEAKRAFDHFEWDFENAPKVLAPEIIYEDDHEVNQIIHEPYGVGVAIVAWNFPVPNFCFSATQALIAGNTMVMKYSEEIPLFSKCMEELCIQAGLGDVIQFVYGDGRVGQMLMEQDIDFLTFTGSYGTGSQLYKKAAEKFIPVVLELGGSSPGIVFEDADLDRIVEKIYALRFVNCGQFCSDLKRLIVHNSLKEELTQRLVIMAEKAVVGDPMNEDTDMGPLVAKRQVLKLEEQVKDAIDKGAKLLCGGKRPEGLEGAYYEPTLLTNISKDMRVWSEEVFGPALPIVGFDTYEEAIALANDTEYGLTGYVFTENQALALKAMSEIKAGALSANLSAYGRVHVPFGGYKHSGLGREKGKYGLHEVTQAKVITWEK